MKVQNNIAAIFIAFLSAVLVFGCGILNKDAKSLTINQDIPAHSKLVIELEDKSGFNVDIENISKDTLILERPGIDNLLIMGESAKAIIAPNTMAALSNGTNRVIKVRVRVRDHKSAVNHRIEAYDPDATVAK